MTGRKLKSNSPWLTLLTLVISLVMVFPVVWLLLSSFKQTGELFTYPLRLFSQAPTIEHYARVIDSGFFNYVKNSLVLAVLATTITLAISAMCGYALAVYRKDVRYANKIFAIFLLGTLIPGETLMIPQFTVISALGLYNKLWGIVLPVVTTTTGIFLYRQHYLFIPLSLAEAARIDGANELQIFTTIMLPLGLPATLTLAIFSFMWRWNDYILPMLVLSEQKKFTIQIAIRNYIGFNGVDWSAILAASILSIIPVLAVFLALQKRIIGGIAATGIKG